MESISPVYLQNVLVKVTEKVTGCKREILIGCSSVLLAKWTYSTLSWWAQYRRHCKFVESYPKDTSLGFLGIVPIIKELLIDDAYHEYRLKLYSKTNSKTVTYRIGTANYLMVSDVNLAKFLMSLPPSIVAKAGVDEFLNCDPHGFQDGLLLDEGETWQIHRKSLSKILNLDILDHYIEAMDTSALTFIEQLCKNDNFRNTSEVLETCARMTFEIMCKCLMGDHDNASQSSNLHPAYIAITDLGNMMAWQIKNIAKVKLANLLPFGNKIFNQSAPEIVKGKRAILVRDDFIQKQIEKAKERIANGDELFDFTSLLLKDTDENGTGTFTMAEIRSQVYTFLFAGHENISSTLQWALYFIGEHPKWSDKICEEFDSIGRTISPSSLKKTPITDAFIKETLRLAHIIDLYLGRTTNKDVKLPNGDVMPKGMSFRIDMGAMMENENIFSNPNEFNPQRFLDNSLKDTDPNWFIPFGGAPRNCIGQVFARQELKITLLRVCSLVSIKNRVLEKDVHDRPPHQMVGLTFKIKPNSLEQKFEHK